MDEKQINRVEAIINSMTQHERTHHEVINGSRRKRIARGSGTSVQEVNNLLRQYAQMREDVQADGQAQLRPPDGGDEDAGNVGRFEFLASGFWSVILSGAESFACE